MTNLPKAIRGMLMALICSSANPVSAGMVTTSELLVRARESAERVARSDDRWWALVEIAGLEARIGHRETGKSQLIRLSKQAKYEFERLEPLSYLIAAEHFDAVKEMVLSNEINKRSMTLYYATGRVINRTPFPGLLQLARLVAGDLNKAALLSLIGVAAAKAGDLQTAKSALNSIRASLASPLHGLPEDVILTHEIEVLCAIGERQAQSSVASAAETLRTAFRQSLKLPKRVGVFPTRRPRNHALRRVAAAFARSGAKGKVWKALGKIDKAQDKDWARLEASLAAAEAGHQELSRSLISSLRGGIGAARGRPILRLVSIKLALGEVEKALDLTSQLAASCDDQSEAIAQIAGHLADAGEFDAARALIDRIGVHSEPSVVMTKGSALVQLVKALAESGKFDAARNEADSIMTSAISDGRSVFKCRVIRGHTTASPENAEGVFAATNKAVARGARYRASQILAEEMAASGLVDQVLAWSQMVEDPKIRVAIFLGAAKGL